MNGRMYTAQFSEVAVTAQQDLFQIEANSVPAIIHAIFLSQSSDVGDAAAEALSILIRRVTDAVTNDITEVKLDQGSASANADLAVNSFTELVTGSEIIHSEAWNIALPFIWMPPPEMRIIVPVGDAVVVNLNTTPADSITMSGSMYFEEVGS